MRRSIKYAKRNTYILEIVVVGPAISDGAYVASINVTTKRTPTLAERKKYQIAYLPIINKDHKRSRFASEEEAFQGARNFIPIAESVAQNRLRISDQKNCLS